MNKYPLFSNFAADKIVGHIENEPKDENTTTTNKMRKKNNKQTILCFFSS